MSRHIVVSIIFLIGAFWFYRFGASTKLENDQYLARTKEAVGTVIGYERTQYDPADPNTVMYKPSIQFTTETGQVVSGQSDMGNNQQPFAVGSTIPVRYDPDFPERVDPKAWLLEASRYPLGWVIAVILGLAGLLWTPLMMLIERGLGTLLLRLWPNKKLVQKKPNAV